MADNEPSSLSDESECPDCLEDMMCENCFEAIRPSDSEGSDDSEDTDCDAESKRAEIHHHYQYYDFRQQHNHYYPPPAPLDAPAFQLPPPNNLPDYPPPDFDRYRSEPTSQSSSESESESDEEKEEEKQREQVKRSGRDRRNQ